MKGLVIFPPPSQEERAALVRAISALVREERARAGPGPWFQMGRILGLRTGPARPAAEVRPAERWCRSYRLEARGALVPWRLGRGDAR